MEIDELGTRARIEQLPFEVRWPMQRALAMWREGDLTGARSRLAVAREALAEVDAEFGAFHVLHLDACIAFSAREYARSRALHEEVLAMCHEIEFLGGMGRSLCDLAMIDLAEGDVEAAAVRYERGVGCYEDGGYLDDAAAAREMWARAAKAS